MDHSEIAETVRQRLADVDSRISAACRRAGRRRDEVTLVAVTKTVSAEVASILPELGVVDLGESRPQELWRMAASLPAGVRWHLVGHLQRNKVEKTLPLTHLIHSADSVRLLHAINDQAASLARTAQVLLEVNMSREANKTGFAPDEVSDLKEALSSLSRVRITGLMTIAALEDDPQRCRQTFSRLRELLDRLKRAWHALGEPLVHLSMGMSNDFEVAVEEGATIVRIGTALFEGLGDLEPK